VLLFKETAETVSGHQRLYWSPLKDPATCSSPKLVQVQEGQDMFITSKLQLMKDKKCLSLLCQPTYSIRGVMSTGLRSKAQGKKQELIGHEHVHQGKQRKHLVW